MAAERRAAATDTAWMSAGAHVLLFILVHFAGNGVWQHGTRRLQGSSCHQLGQAAQQPDPVPPVGARAYGFAYPITPGGHEGSPSPNLRPELGEHRRRHLAERCQDGHASIHHSADDRYQAMGSKTASGEFDKPRACPHRDTSSPACFVLEVSLSSTACSGSTLINLSCEKSNSESEHGKHQLGGSQRMSFYRNQQLAGLALCFQSQQLTLQPRCPTHTSPLSCIRCMWHDEHKACPTLPGFYNTCTTTGAHLPLGEALPCILHQHSASDTPAQRGARLVPDSSVLESPILYHSMLDKRDTRFEFCTHPRDRSTQKQYKMKISLPVTTQICFLLREVGTELQGTRGRITELQGTRGAFRTTLRNLVLIGNLNILKQTDTSHFLVQIFLTLSRDAEIKDWYNRGLLWDLDYASKEQKHQQAVAVHKGSSWEFGVLSAYTERCGFGSCLCLAKDI
ncbi:hypothetical protein Anapl_09464 [Anas platyrhynchos]|uniref:Uncharacterized protein n=1 Tax=Anas platyrhynchos TaxID=8839 RepID=R0JYD5_ANAPL|nr:hypothetical protein Anapl_09464 [Anas platyrhynchos]